MSKRLIWILVLAAASAVALVGRVLAVARAPSARVEPGDLAERIIGRAAVVAIDGVAEVRARVEGRVLRVEVHEGDRVREGDVLAEIESESIRAEIARREAEHAAAASSARGVAEGMRPEERSAAASDVRAAQHDFALAEDRARRAERLRGSGVTSDQDARNAAEALEIARARLATAEARLRLSRAGGRPSDVSAARARAVAAGAAVDIARQELGRARIVAPVSGIVLVRRVDPGDTITAAGAAGAPAFEIADTARNELRVEIEEIDAMRVEIGQQVTIRGPGGRPTVGVGHVQRLSARLERRSIGLQDARVRADALVRSAWVGFDRPMGVALGQQLEAVIDLAPRHVGARLPREAVAIRDGRPVVDVPAWLLVREVPVQLGIADDRYVEVRDVGVGTRVLRH